MTQRGLQVTRVPIPPAPPRASRQQAAADNAMAYGNCGIHAISISPDGSAPPAHPARLHRDGMVCNMLDRCTCGMCGCIQSGLLVVRIYAGQGMRSTMFLQFAQCRDLLCKLIQHCARSL